MTDDKLYIDEVRRTANYETARSGVEAEVATAAAAPSVEPAEVGRALREDAVSQIAETHREVERGRVAARISQIVDYFFFLIYGLLAIRLLLELFAAREGVAFFRFIKALTDPVYFPFRGIVPSLSTPNGFSLELSLVVAIVVYALLHMAINGILRLAAHRKVEI